MTEELFQRALGLEREAVPDPVEGGGPGALVD